MGVSSRKLQDIFSFALSNTQDNHVLSGFAHPRRRRDALLRHPGEEGSGSRDLGLWYVLRLLRLLDCD